MSQQASATSGWRTPAIVIVAGCLISIVGFGVRSSFGLFLEPMTVAKGWDRETFALAMALQNLLWGVGLPVAGALADRYGPSRVLALGAIVYGVGVWGMAEASSGLGLHLFGGLTYLEFSVGVASALSDVDPGDGMVAFH